MNGKLMPAWSVPVASGFADGDRAADRVVVGGPVAVLEGDRQLTGLDRLGDLDRPGDGVPGPERGSIERDRQMRRRGVRRHGATQIGTS